MPTRKEWIYISWFLVMLTVVGLMTAVIFGSGNYRNPKIDGMKAFQAGVSANANPYQQHFEKLSWLDGWIEASELAKEQSK